MAQHGVYSQRTLSNSFRTDAVRTMAEIAVLFSLGVLAVVLHKAFRIPLHLPGKQGIIWIALLVSGRCTSSLSGAGAITGTGAAIASVAISQRGDPFDWLVYLAAGFAADFIFGTMPRSRRGMALFAATFGMIHVLKPVIRQLVALFFGLPHGSLINGLPYPAATHFVFGTIGALFGIIMAQAIIAARDRLGH